MTNNLPTYLAKAEPDGSWHPLAAHCLDVAAVTRRLLQDDSHIAGRIRRFVGGADWSAFEALAVYLAAVHDVGKVNNKFQVGLRERLDGGPKKPLGHVKVVLDSLRLAGGTAIGANILAAFAYLVAPMRASEDYSAQLFVASLAHHGRPYLLDTAESGRALDLEFLWGSLSGASRRPPLDEIRRLVDLAFKKSGLEQFSSQVDVPEDVTLTHLLAGLITLADWIGSTSTAFPFTPSAEANLDDYWDAARNLADVACRSIGVVASRRVVSLNAATLYQKLFPGVFSVDSGNLPTSLQQEVVECSRDGRGALRLIEASTGSGKTEAALAHFAQLRAAGEVGGLMFALPTRATARAMKDRIEALVKELYIGDPPPVTLAVGGASPVGKSVAPQLSENPSFPDAESDLTEDLIAWSTGFHKKFLAGEIVVGTVDQAMLAVLAVKHAHMRLVALSRHLLVVDEVHSHDVYMTTVLKELLAIHLASGGHALLMSATLSSAARSTLVDVEPPPLEDALAVPYPTLAVARTGHGWANAAVTGDGNSRTVAWSLITEASVIDMAKSAAEAGARVCIIRNTVGAAQDTAAKIVADAPHLMWGPAGSAHKPPYHSRYARQDRDVLDAAIIDSFGKGATTGGSIVVATQVIEQSLDVDFDFVISDLAPIEILLQRVGRLHRHATRDGLRPSQYSVPKLVVVGPDAPFLPSAGPIRNTGWGTVYKNTIALELTRRLIGCRKAIKLPNEYRILMEAVYDSSAVETFVRSEGWTEELNKVEGAAASHELHARDSTLAFDEYYSTNALKYGSEILVRTRIGDDTVEVKLDPPSRCWYAPGGQAPTVSIRLDDVRTAGLKDLEDVTAVGHVDDSGVSRYRIGKLELTYGPTGWIRSTA